MCILIPLVAGASHIYEAPTSCQLEGFSIQFFYISAMFWLNSMCIDIWCTFRRLRVRARALKSISVDAKLPKGTKDSKNLIIKVRDNITFMKLFCYFYLLQL